MSIVARSLAVLLLLACGCDMLKTDERAPKLEERKTNASGDRSGLAGCLDQCAAEDASPTDGHTCRNNCEMAFKVTPTADDPVLAKAARCMHRCHAGDDAGKCLRGCRRTAAAAGGDKQVLERLGTCVGGCEHDRSLTKTDRYTCVLNCSQTARAAPPQS